MDFQIYSVAQTVEEAAEDMTQVMEWAPSIPKETPQMVQKLPGRAMMKMTRQRQLETDTDDN